MEISYLRLQNSAMTETGTTVMDETRTARSRQAGSVTTLGSVSESRSVKAPMASNLLTKLSTVLTTTLMPVTAMTATVRSRQGMSDSGTLG